MSLSLFFALQFLIVIGACVQTVTGGSFVTLALTGIILIDALPLEQAVLLIMMLSLCHIGLVLEKKSFAFANLHRIAFLWVIIPSTVVGVVLLYTLIEYPMGYQVLYAIFGVGTLLASIMLFMAGKPRKTESHKAVFYLWTTIAGITGGLFSTSAPPMVYLLYNQPWQLHTVRQTLLTAFAIVIITRSAVVLYQGNFVYGLLWWTALSIPTLVITTLVTKKYMHLLQDMLIRKVTFVLLFIGGVNMLIRSYQEIIMILYT